MLQPPHLLTRIIKNIHLELDHIPTIRITGCEKLAVLPEDIHNLASLQELEIDYLEGLTSFPPNLTSLQVYEVKSCKKLWEWGLHKLTSLKKLLIQSEDPDVVSFPPHAKEEMLLRKSLTELTISGFPNLKKFSKSIQFLTSLQTLRLRDCPKLASIPAASFTCPIYDRRVSSTRREMSTWKRKILAQNITHSFLDI